MDQRAEKLKPTPVVSRPLIAVWCLWLLASWALNLGIDSPRWWSAEAFVPPVRGMMQSMMVGLGLGWPAWRLSQGRARLAGPETVADLLCLLLVLQIVLWPMHLLVGWTLDQILLINAVAGVWALAIGLVVWLGRRGRTAGARVAAMGGCVLILFGGWALAALTGEARLAGWSPMHMLWVMAGDAGRHDAGAVTARLAVVLLAVMAAWAAALIALPRGDANATRPGDRRDGGPDGLPKGG